MALVDYWPWPDDRLERRSRVAHMYRDRLADEAPDACAELDEVMHSFGQCWIIEGFAVDPETLLTTDDLAEVADVTVNAVRNWVARWPLAPRGRNDAGRTVYRWGDVIEHHRARKGTRRAT